MDLFSSIKCGLKLLYKLVISILKLGFKIDYSYSSPDFVIKTRKQKLEMVIEAVSTRHAEDGTPEYERINAIDNLYKKGKIDTEYHKEIVHLATERLASSISNKALLLMLLAKRSVAKWTISL